MLRTLSSWNSAGESVTGSIPNNTAFEEPRPGLAARSGAKSRWHWDCLDAYDLLTLGEGTNPRYPGSRGQRLIDRKDIGDDIAWLLDENRRTVYVKTTAKFKQGIMGKGRVQRIHPDGTTEEENAD